jgi:hypothetical protein
MQLELRPRLGDTLRMRLDQVTEVSGSRKGGSATMKAVVTTLTMFSRAIVESSAPASALILAVTDSVEVTSTDEHARALAATTQRQMRGRQMRLRLAPDGTVSVAPQTGDIPKEVTDLVSVMPASFPKDPVAVGEIWFREMPIASGASLGMPVGGVVRAVFRLDSVSRAGELAYVSMRGALEQQPALLQGAAASSLAGSVTGTIVVNRRRGWLSESRFLVEMRTTVAGRSVAPTAPMQFQMKITQHMTVFDKR